MDGLLPATTGTSGASRWSAVQPLGSRAVHAPGGLAAGACFFSPSRKRGRCVAPAPRGTVARPLRPVPKACTSQLLGGALTAGHAPKPSSAVSSSRAAGMLRIPLWAEFPPAASRKRMRPDLLPRGKPGAGLMNCVRFRSSWLYWSFSSTHPSNPLMGPGGWTDSCLLRREPGISRRLPARMRADPWGPLGPAHLVHPALWARVRACLPPRE